MSVRSLYHSGWERVQGRLVRGVQGLDTQALGLTAAGWPIWALVAHIAGARVYWLCHVLGEAGADTTPFTDTEMGWEDDLETPRGAAELVGVLEATWAITERCLDSWNAAMLEETFERPLGGVVQLHTRQSVLVRLISHDAYHCGEISLTLGMNGLDPMDPWSLA